MKKFLGKITKALNKTAVGAKTALSNTKAEGYVDSGIKIIIAVVIGGLLLAALYTLFNTEIIPTLTSKVTEMFSYCGS